jgi:hypothetical protein
LSAPILEINVAQLGDDSYWNNSRKVLEAWIEVENYNLTQIRAGLLRFRMPQQYRTNELALHSAVVEQCRTQPSDEQLRKGILHLADCLICLGSQFYSTNDRLGSVEAGLLLRHIHHRFPQFFQGAWAGTLTKMFFRLTTDLPAGIRKDHLYAGIEEIERRVVSSLVNAGATSNGNAS